MANAVLSDTQPFLVLLCGSWTIGGGSLLRHTAAFVLKFMSHKRTGMQGTFSSSFSRKDDSHPPPDSVSARRVGGPEAGVLKVELVRSGYCLFFISLHQHHRRVSGFYLFFFLIHLSADFELSVIGQGFSGNAGIDGTSFLLTFIYTPIYTDGPSKDNPSRWHSTNWSLLLAAHTKTIRKVPTPSQFPASQSPTNTSTARLEKLILTNGGSFAKAIDEDVTHLVTTQVDFDKGSVKGT